LPKERKWVKATESKAKVKRKAVRRPDFLISVFGMNGRVVGLHCHIQNVNMTHFQNGPTTKPLCSKRCAADALALWCPSPPKVAPSVHPKSIGCRFHKRRAATKTPAVATQNGLQKTYASPKCVIKSGYDWNSIVIVGRDGQWKGPLSRP
jgi:hypothetical protein